MCSLQIFKSSSNFIFFMIITIILFKILNEIGGPLTFKEGLGLGLKLFQAGKVPFENYSP